MSISHIGHRPSLPIVPQQQSTPSTDAGATGLDRSLLPDMRKMLPPQAKGAANGLSVQKIFDKLDADGDGVITQAEAGPRWGHGLLGELLKLQMTGQAPATDGTDGASDGTAGTDTTTAGSGADTSAAGAGGTDSIAGGAGADTTSAGAGGADSIAGGAGSDTTGTDATALTASLTPPPPSGDLTPDPSQLLDDPTA